MFVLQNLKFAKSSKSKDLRRVSCLGLVNNFQHFTSVQNDTFSGPSPRSVQNEMLISQKNYIQEMIHCSVQMISQSRIQIVC